MKVYICRWACTGSFTDWSKEPPNKTNRMQIRAGDRVIYRWRTKTSAIVYLVRGVKKTGLSIPLETFERNFVRYEKD